ncbi:MAG: glycoside hydrolase TIM-barrel-like domain-containing protein [Pseudomonadota bacterium]
MARIALTQAGAALGRRILPQSFQLLGRRFSGSSLGRRLGGLASDALEDALTPPREGPRLDALQVMESREGAGISDVYGRMRVAGQLIWAGAFTERRETVGGKGGPRVNEYSYSVSFAIGVCEGPGARIERVWANGEPLEMGRYSHRIYSGSNDQSPDPTLEATLGAGMTPAYKGLCYIVFEDFPLNAFGNRIPNLSFEVVRSPTGQGDEGLRDHVRAVNLIPATGEFVYSSQPVSVRTFPGRETPLNVHTADGRADLLVSLDQLQAELPKTDSVSLTVGWFGDDLRAGHCQIKPGVETRERTTVPLIWRAGDTSRKDAYLISQDASGNANYGGTPSDETVIQAMREMAMRGLDVTLTPFLLMDIPAGNPMGQATFPWRGRISSTASGSNAASDDVAAFMGGATTGDFQLDGDRVNYSGASNDWGYRRFILHLAWLAKASGACSAFLIGSEMRDLTRVQSADGSFPFVDALVMLASDVKFVLGPDCAVSYAADWSEYGAFVPDGGSGDVFFPLDPLWASPAIDFVGIDWYPPAGDWRDGDTHVDRLDGTSSSGEISYIIANQTGGEAFDWYYSSAADRDLQVRTPILDTAHGEDWVFRSKDVTAWWNNFHHNRPGGVRSALPTPWVPGSKPIRFSEIGFPAVDKGINSPNLFFDPKSSESAVPPYSSGARDDVLQSAALVGALGYWQALPHIEQAVVWAWDARPFPAFPSRGDVWSDGENWSYGHWLNGRTGLSPLVGVLDDLSERAGIDIDTSNVVGLVEGLALNGVMALHEAMEPLRLAYGLIITESQSGLRILGPGTGETESVVSAELTGTPKLQRETVNEPAGRLHLAYAGFSSGFQVQLAEARDGGGDQRRVLALELPMSFSAPEAERIAARILVEANLNTQCELSLPAIEEHIATGSRLHLNDTNWVVGNAKRGLEDTLLLVPEYPHHDVLLGVSSPDAPASLPPVLDPDLLVIDAPTSTGSAMAEAVVAVFADPWPGVVSVQAEQDVDQFSERALVESPSLTGRLLSPLPPGPLYRWDHVSTLDAEFAFSGLGSRQEQAVLSGANTLLVQTSEGWECLSFLNAELTAPATYRLSGFLRGQKGTELAAEVGAESGARCVLLDAGITRVSLSNEDVGREFDWRAGDTGREIPFTFQNRGAWPLRPAHAVQRRQDGNVEWSIRDLAIPDSWDAPDPVIGLTFDVQWIDSGGNVTITRVAGTPVNFGVDVTATQVRSVSSGGWVSDWVPIRIA